MAASGIWNEVESAAFSPVLRKPNRYQTRIQFLSQWIVSKLLYGNTYILKERDQRGVVVAMYVLDPKLVVPLVAEDGSVFYELKQDYLSGLSKPITVPADEIIHDRMMTPWHPLIGVSPIFASGSSATHGIRIQAMSAKFFENMSRPSGMLTAPGSISNDTASRLKAEFEARFSGQSIGGTFVGSDGLKYEAFTMPFVDAQLIEQLRWTVEDVARTFHVPLHKLGMGQPTLNNIGALNQDYYTQTLQKLIEDVELLLDEGLGLINVKDHTYGTELDLDGLLRMDPLSRMETWAKGVGAAVFSPNEARLKENLAPADGGDSPMIQQQNYSLAALARRDAKADPFAATPAAAPALPAPSDQNAPAKALYERMLKNIESMPELDLV
jgi:HK97 family phage portal protein